MKIHNKQKQFECSVCHKRFHRKANKNHHEKIHTVRHPGQTRINEHIKQPKLHQNAISGQSPVPGHPAKRRVRSVSEPPPSKRQRVEEVGGQINVPRKRVPPGPREKPSIYRVAAAFKQATVTWKLICPPHETSTIATMLNECTFDMKGKLSHFRVKNPAVKFCMAIHATFRQETDESIKTFPPIVL